MRATLHAEGLQEEPPPKIYLREFGESAITYEIKFWMLSHKRYNEICDAIRTNIWYEFKRQKITIPFPIRTLEIPRRPSSKPQEEQAAPARFSRRSRSSAASAKTRSTPWLLDRA